MFWKLFIFLDSVTFFFNAPFFSLYSSLNAVLNSVFAFGYAICPLNCLSNPFFQMYRLRVNRCAYFQAQFLLSYFSIEVASSSFLLLGFLDLWSYTVSEKSQYLHILLLAFLPFLCFSHNAWCHWYTLSAFCSRVRPRTWSWTEWRGGGWGDGREGGIDNLVKRKDKPVTSPAPGLWVRRQTWLTRTSTKYLSDFLFHRTSVSWVKTKESSELQPETFFLSPPPDAL